MRVPTLPRPRVSIALLALLLGGCVAKGRYELATVQLEATRAALSAREAAARENLDAERAKHQQLEAQLAEVQAELEAQRGRVTELEEEIDRNAYQIAEFTVRSLTECPPLPEPVECPTDPEAPPPEPTPEPEPEPEPVQQRRAHTEASLEEMVDALETRSQLRLEAAERRSRHLRVVEAFQSLVDEGLATVDADGETSIVRLLVAKLYNENRTTLSPLGVTIVERVQVALEALPNHRLQLVGHTDDRVQNSATIASNWELGFAYAVGVLRPLADAGLPIEMSAASLAGTEPLVDNTDDESRRLNRRVELRLTPVPPTPGETGDEEGDGEPEPRETPDPEEPDPPPEEPEEPDPEAG